MSTPLLVHEEGPLTRLVLNRPERRNALSDDLMEELTRAVSVACGRVIVIEGAGPAFSAGHDLSEMIDRSPATYSRLFAACTNLMEAIHRARQPVIAQVHGMASAAGCQLVAACDLAVAATGARFATPGVKIGLFCSTPMVPLTRAIGRKRALGMLLTGEPIDATTALTWGLVNDVVPEDTLRERVEGLAGMIASASPLTLAIGKDAFYRQVDVPEAEAYALTTHTMALNAMTEDAQEGMAAFLAKRPPRWTGR